MRHVGIALLGLVAALAVCGAATASASAVSCYQVHEKHTGNFKNSACTEESGKGEYIEATLEKEIESEVWCAKLASEERLVNRNYYTSVSCTGTKSESGEYTPVRVSLPTILFLSGGPTVLFNTLPSNILSQLQTTSVKTLEGSGLNLELTFLNLNNMSLGEYLVFVDSVKRVGGVSGEECKNVGGTAGVVNIHGEIHLVYDNLATETGGLGVGTLFLVPATTIECFESNGTKTIAVEVKGSTLGLIKPINTWVEPDSNIDEVLARCSGTTAGKTGKPSETRYWNDNSEPRSASLEVEAGKGVEKGCELVGGNNTQVVTLLPTEMTEVDG